MPYIRPHPGRIFRNRILPHLNMTPELFAAHIGIDVDYMQKLINLDVGITPEFAAACESKGYGDRHLWLTLQEAHDNQTA